MKNDPNLKLNMQKSNILLVCCTHFKTLPRHGLGLLRNRNRQQR